MEINQAGLGQHGPQARAWEPPAGAGSPSKDGAWRADRAGRAAHMKERERARSAHRARVRAWAAIADPPYPGK